MPKTTTAELGPADEAARLMRRAAALLGKGKLAEAAALQQRISELLATASAEPTTTRIPAAHPSVAVPADRSQSTREIILDSLNDLGVASSPREVADYAQARFGISFEARLFASLRRDEQRAWKSTRSHRPVYVVPALTAAAPSRLLAMRGKLARSDWPLELRLIGPWTERVDHLTATINLARQLAWLHTAKPTEAQRVSLLVSRYAATVPDALGERATPDPARIERAARAELDVVGHRDLEWRANTATTARQLVDPDQQVWGVPLPQLLESTG